jgi:carboxyl-terminal processing protease
MSLDKAVSLMKGDPGTEVNLTIERKINKKDVSKEEKKEEKITEEIAEGSEEKVIEVSITRAIIDVPNVKSEVKADNIAYVRVIQFTQNVGEDVEEE